MDSIVTIKVKNQTIFIDYVLVVLLATSGASWRGWEGKMTKNGSDRLRTMPPT